MFNLAQFSSIFQSISVTFNHETIHVLFEHCTLQYFIQIIKFIESSFKFHFIAFFIFLFDTFLIGCVFSVGLRPFDPETVSDNIFLVQWSQLSFTNEITIKTEARSQTAANNVIPMNDLAGELRVVVSRNAITFFIASLIHPQSIGTWLQTDLNLFCLYSLFVLFFMW